MRKFDLNLSSVDQLFREMNWFKDISVNNWEPYHPITTTYYFTGSDTELSTFNYQWEYDTKNCKKLIVNIPGFSKDDVVVSVEKEYIVVEVNKSIQKFSFDSDNYDVDSAECKNGQLIIFTKMKEKSFKTIEVK